MSPRDQAQLFDLLNRLVVAAERIADNTTPKPKSESLWPWPEMSG